jgi:hypothetical protein
MGFPFNTIMAMEKNPKRQTPNPKKISNGVGNKEENSTGDKDGAQVEGFNIQFFLAFGPWRL